MQASPQRAGQAAGTWQTRRGAAREGHIKKAVGCLRVLFAHEAAARWAGYSTGRQLGGDALGHLLPRHGRLSGRKVLGSPAASAQSQPDGAMLPPCFVGWAART